MTDPITGELTEERWREFEQRSQTKRKVLCPTCNNEWGSTLESGAKKIVPTMIYGQMNSLLTAGTLALAKWVFKVALLIEQLDPPESHVVTEAQRFHFRQTGEPPENTLILAFAVWNNAAWWKARPRHTHGMLLPDDGTIPEHPNVHITSFGLGRVAFVVAGSSIPDVPIYDLSQITPEAAVRLWPEPGPRLWPVPRLPMMRSWIG